MENYTVIRMWTASGWIDRIYQMRKLCECVFEHHLELIFHIIYKLK
jgi:hypothetical protein